MGKSATYQQAFRFRNDDGSQTSATFMGTGNNQNQTLSTGTSNRFRIRVVCEETAAGTNNMVVTFYYSYNGGTYAPISGSSSYIRAISSVNTSWTLSDDDATTAQLGYSGTFTTGRYTDDGAAASSASLSSNYTEFELCCYIVDADVSNSDTIDIRAYASGVAITGYNQTPRVTVSKSVVHTPSVDDIASVVALDGSLTLDQLHKPSVDDITSLVDLQGTLDVVETYTLVVDDLTSLVDLEGSLALDQVHKPSVDDIASVVDLDSSLAFDVTHKPSVDDLTSLVALDGVPFEAGTAIVVDDIASLTTLDSVSLVYNLIVDDIASLVALDSSLAFDQVHKISVDDLVSLVELDSSLAFDQVHKLSVDDIASLVSLDTVYFGEEPEVIMKNRAILLTLHVALRRLRKRASL